MPADRPPDRIHTRNAPLAAARNRGATSLRETTTVDPAAHPRRLPGPPEAATTNPTAPPRPATPSRRAVLAGGAAALAGVGWNLARPSAAGAIGQASRIRLARLHLPNLPDPRPSGWRRLAWELERRTSLVIEPEPVAVAPGDATLFKNPLLILSGDRGFALPSDGDLARLRRHLLFGGFLIIDSAEGRPGGPFDESVRQLMARLLPGDLPGPLPADHVLWKSFYILDAAPGRLMTAPRPEVVERDRRVVVVYSQNDLAGAWARDGFGRWEHDVAPGGDRQRETSFRFGVNLVMYALCLDYKSEQAHIEYILRRPGRRLPR